MIKRVFTEHPASVGESYVEHLGMASGFGAKMVVSGIACMIHAVFPFLFVCTGRKCIEELHARMVTHRDRRQCAEVAAPSHMPSLARETQSLHAAE